MAVKLLLLLVLSDGQPNETSGEVFGFILLYSGNFLLQTEMDHIGTLRVNFGVNPTWCKSSLPLGKFLSTPETILCRSSEGVGGLSRLCHKLFRQRLVRYSQLFTSSQAYPRLFLSTADIENAYINHDYIIRLAGAVRVE